MRLSVDNNNMFDRNSLAKIIDHTLLKPSNLSYNNIQKFFIETYQHDFASLCIPPSFVPQIAFLNRETGNNVVICTVVGFPLGLNKTNIKIEEAKQAVLDGALEIDVVIHVPYAIGRDYEYIEYELSQIVKETKQINNKIITKAIIETAMLPDDIKIVMCKICNQSNIDYIKTSTGFSSAGGATIRDVELLNKYKGNCKIKASGGITDLSTTLYMISAGADRIGTSSGVQILEEYDKANK